MLKYSINRDELMMMIVKFRDQLSKYLGQKVTGIQIDVDNHSAIIDMGEQSMGVREYGENAKACYDKEWFVSV